MTDPATVETPKPLSLEQKIAAISASVRKIKMTGFNKDSNYKYLKIEDVVDAVRPGMEAHGLILTPEVQALETVPETKGILFRLTVLWKLRDVTTGDSMEFTMPGTGWDFHDKGVYKALTGSRKYALILIFNLPVGDNPEQAGGADRDAKATQRGVAAKKIGDAAGRGVPAAIEAILQTERDKKIVITRPEELNGHFFHAEGYIAIPDLDQFFEDTGCKRFKRKTDGVPYWRVPADYEKGFVDLCDRLKIEVEG